MIDIDQIVAKPRAAVLCLIGYAISFALALQCAFRYGVRTILYLLGTVCFAIVLLFIARSYARPGKRLSRAYVWSTLGIAGFGVLMTMSPGFETPVRIALAALGTACLMLPLLYVWRIWKAKPRDAT